ncbi:MAG TPA: hypothetical protein VLT86_20270 [Vicinamibacterales bacterium]|nr:hypothetical protein [Vicinamibacterales bacterium]
MRRLGAWLVLGAAIAAAPTVKITVKRGSDRELRTKAELEKVLRDYDLTKYLFTRDVVIEEQAINHAFPELTLNARFADSEDDLLSSFVHEELHWHLRDRGSVMPRVVADLRQLYPRVPVGGTEGAETEYSTYGHLIDCYLEILADRQLIGPERTAAVIARKGHYTWIYKTDLQDEPRIATIVARYQLAVR